MDESETIAVPLEKSQVYPHRGVGFPYPIPPEVPRMNTNMSVQMPYAARVHKLFSWALLCLGGRFPSPDLNTLVKKETYRKVVVWEAISRSSPLSNCHFKHIQTVCMKHWLSQNQRLLRLYSSPRKNGINIVSYCVQRALGE